MEFDEFRKRAIEDLGDGSKFHGGAMEYGRPVPWKVSRILDPEGWGMRHEFLGFVTADSKVNAFLAAIDMGYCDCLPPWMECHVKPLVDAEDD